MKKLITLSFAIIAVIMLTGCEESVTLDTPDVDYTVADSGATLTLSWVEITDADGYIIYADGDSIDEITTTTYDATVPAAEYEVTAYAGEDESDPATIDCAPVVTSNITVYGMSDTSTAHPSGLQFTTSGTAVAISVQSSNYPDLDYLFDDRSPLTTITIISPDDYVPPYNDEENTTAASGTDFHALDIAADFGNYSTQRALADQAVYSLWIDPDHAGYTTDDHFGKMKIESITGSAAPYTVVITAAYQPIAGLRWLVTQ